ncbi:hypothetical protein PENTCL1PPCAC_25558, partial [Pristionchus entomophagus]
YEYAIVSGCIRPMILVLVRNPETFKAKFKNEVLKWLDETNGFSSRDLDEPAYSDCYFDSITQTTSSTVLEPTEPLVTSSPEGNHDTVDSSSLSPEVPSSIRPSLNDSCDQSNITLAVGMDMQMMMGRWFEGLVSPREDNRNCNVYEYHQLEMIWIHPEDEHYSIHFETGTTYRETGHPMRKKHGGAS